VDDLDEFMEGRRIDLAGRTAVILRELATNLDIDKIGRELHRIVGTCGTYGLTQGSRSAAELLAQVRSNNVADLAVELTALADVFAAAADGREN